VYPEAKDIRQNVHEAFRNIHQGHAQLEHGERSAVQGPRARGVVLTLPLGVHAALAVVAWCRGEVELSPLVAGEDARRPRAQGRGAARPA
jgi:hypothetical protein